MKQPGKLFSPARRNIKSEKGFTLIELMTVMMLITVLVGIAIAIYINLTQPASDETHNANVRILIGAVHLAINNEEEKEFVVGEGKTMIWHYNSPGLNEDNPCWTDYLQEWPEIPSGSRAYGLGENQGTEYKVFLEYPGPSVTVEPPRLK